MKRLKAVIKKEFLHILRDPASLSIVFLMPVVMIFIFGYSMSFDLDSIPTGMIDYANTQESRALKNRFKNSRYFKVTEIKPSENPNLESQHLKTGEFREIVIIPRDFSIRLQKKQKTSVGFIIDGSDSNIANLVFQYNEMVLMDYISDYLNIKDLLKIKTHLYFNPEAKSTYFFIPGIVAILLLMISALLTSISITRERESGSLDLILISPIRSAEIIIGKTIPYVAVSITACLFILVLARFWFQIPFRGNFFILMFFSLIYIVTGLALGIMVSVVAPSQKSAMLAVLIITLLPSVMLSGFIFPLDSMGVVLRWISHIVPATYFLKIIRGVVVKGASLNHFMAEGGILLMLGMFLLTAAIKKFNRFRGKVR
jgi:ABC-2 type transport system permease protein